MPKPTLSFTADPAIQASFQAQLAEARATPGLSGLVTLPAPDLYPRYSDYYRQLSQLPRRVRRSLQRQWKRSLSALALLLALGQVPALAATINVDGTSCALANAIRSANTDTAVGGCTTGSGADTLVLTANSTHTLTTIEDVTYGVGLPLVTSTITIEGSNSTIARAATAPDFGILHVSYSSLTLNDTTVTGGKGFGIENFSSTLTLNRSIVSENAGSGISVGGAPLSITLNQSTVSGNEGFGISSLDRLTLNQSTIAGNGGGGVSHSYGPATLTETTISGNTGFGIRISQCGYFDPGLSISNSTISGNQRTGISIGDCGATITNSTISGNTSAGRGGGISLSRGAVRLVHTTVSGNSATLRGGGLHNGFYAHINLVRSLISGNDAPQGPEAYNEPSYYGSNMIHGDDFNLVGHSGNTGAVGFIPGATDIVPSQGLGAILAPLTANGGPTQTHALVADSPAIDASPVDKACAVNDQRGVFRPQGSACDIGAFEVGVELDPFASPTPTMGCTVNDVPNQSCIGTADKDTIVGTTGNDVIAGLNGRDVLLGRNGNDRIFGGRGNDQLTGNMGNDFLAGGKADDTLLGNEGSDTLLGEAGKDDIKGGTGDDFLDGGPDTDKLNGQQGTDTCVNGESVSGCP